MGKKTFIVLFILIALLAISIILMSISLMLDEKVFGQISSYIAIACVVITLAGVVVVIVNNHKKKDEDLEDDVE